MNNDIAKPIRILHVIGIMNRGGAEAMIMNLYREIDKSKVQFDFVQNSFEPAVFDEEILSLGGKIYRCPHFNGKNYFGYKKWWQNFFKEHSEYKIIHGHIGSTASIYLGEAKKHGIFTIAHSHNTNRNVTVKDYLYALLSYRTRFIADYFFGCSTEAGKSRFGKKIINRSNYSNFANAINVEEYKYNEEVRKKIRLEFGVKDDDLLIGTIGRLTYQKNPEMIYKIFKSILEIESNAKCVWVGTGEFYDKIKDWIDSDNLQERIILTGVRSDVPNILQGLDCFVFPSLYEGLGVVIIESQAAGVPSVISKTIPKECILVEHLVSVKDLSDTPMEWARTVLKRSNYTHPDFHKEIINKGYDIKTTARWLEDFYIEHEKRK